MREILFRGIRFDNGEWVYGCLLQNAIGLCWIVEKLALMSRMTIMGVQKELS